MVTDFHLHTSVSDGELEPVALLRRAKSHGITHLSITDHDALGAYLRDDGVVFAEARRLDLELTVGIEMDADLDGLEVHVLGFGVALDHPRLRAHLDSVREARFARARREIGLVNGLLGEGAITEAAIFVPGRETLMKPHFIHPLLDQGRFPTYEDANAWYRANVKAGIAVPKPPFAEALRLIHEAGGWASLAHPGYYAKAGLAVVERLAEWQALGLDAIELDYPYHACSPRQFSEAEEGELLSAVRRAGEAAGLRFTRGSDSHTPGDFERVYGPLPS
jgi:3',5'-nucleoside bisphosphate phosphatase